MNAFFSGKEATLCLITFPAIALSKVTRVFCQHFFKVLPSLLDRGDGEFRPKVSISLYLPSAQTFSSVLRCMEPYRAFLPFSLKLFFIML